MDAGPVDRRRIGIYTEMSPWSASTRHRALQHVPRLRERLGDVDVHLAQDEVLRRPGPIGRGLYFGTHGVRYLQRWRHVGVTIGDHDAVLVQRGLYVIGPGAIAREVTRFDGRVVLDLDDAVFEPHPELARKGPAAAWLYGPQQAARLLDRADAVVVSTPELGSRLPDHVPTPIVLPTVPDVARYRRAAHEAVGGVIGWAGTSGGVMFLDPLAEPLARLRARGLGTLRVVSSVPWSGPSDFVRWREADEPELFAEFAVGIMPLPDTPYTRSKAGFKLLQYMAAGVPVVASPVGVNGELVSRSGAGLLAESPDEWGAALQRLLEEPETRRRMGEAGRRFVDEYADLDGQAEVLASLLRPPS